MFKGRRIIRTLSFSVGTYSIVLYTLVLGTI